MIQESQPFDSTFHSGHEPPHKNRSPVPPLQSDLFCTSVPPKQPPENGIHHRCKNAISLQEKTIEEEETRNRCSIKSLLSSSPLSQVNNPQSSPSQPPISHYCPFPSSKSPLRDRKIAPLHKLTTSIYETFTKIKQQRENGAEVPDLRYDNENFEYKIMKGEIFNDRYETICALGKGTFGQVVKCLDRVTEKFVALKIIKSQSLYAQQGIREINLLKEMNEVDSNDEYGIVRLLDNFEHRNHQCLVFELLSSNLYDVLQKTKFKGLSLSLIRKIAYQVLTSLYFLSPSGTNIIHSDLKPENILLREPTKSGVKIIDFGSSCRRNERIYTYIQSRFYRAPEVILGLPYFQAIDMWSLGCILVELHTGEPLFAGDDENQQLGLICEVFGMPPHGMVTASPKSSTYFQQTGKRTFSLKSNHSDNVGKRSLASILGATTGGPDGRWKDTPGHDPEHYQRFIDLLNRMLAFTPEERIKPMKALHHPFFTAEHNWCDVPSKDEGPAGKKRRPTSAILMGIGSKSPKKYRKRSSSRQPNKLHL